MESRELKGLGIAARMRVERQGDLWSVPASVGPGKYRVDPDAPSCTCEDFLLRAKPCKHVFAVRFVVEREGGVDLKADLPAPAAKPQSGRPTYKQNWPAYVRAQSSEKHRFQTLLADLCSGVPEPPRAKTGRKPVPLADAVFAACFKVYTTLAARRFNCDLSDAHADGHLSRAIHPHKVSAFLDNPDLTPILYRLITESASPLAAVEVDFACDSSAFSTSRYVRWYDEKYGKERSAHVWLKVQIMCGVKTNVVTAIEVCERDGADGPYLPGLVETTAERFKVGEVSADKGYSSTAGHDAVANAGGTPFIAFRTDATGGVGGLYQKMFHYFQYRRDEFLAHYHKRSNVESVFSAVKRKFGDAMRSKTRTAQVNELLCKFLSHNLCVLIQEQEEMGVAPLFWDESERGYPATIKFARL